VILVCTRAALFASLCWALLAPGARGQELPTMHGPLLSWHADPTATMTVTWIERTARPIPGTWARGRAPFGFGDGDEATDLSVLRGVRTDFAIRTRFDAAVIPAGGELGLEVRYDDGFVAHLNGVEVARGGFEEGRVRGHEARGEPEWFPLPEASALLAPEGNVLALVGYNVSRFSADLTLDPALLVRDENGATLAAPVPHGAEWDYMVDGEPPPRWLHGDDAPAPVPPPWPDPSAPEARRVWFREASETQWRAAEAGARPFGPTRDTVRSAVLEGLSPDATYAVAVAPVAPRDGEPVAIFRTAPATLERPLRFSVGGDMYGSRFVMDAMNRRCAAEDSSFAVLGGDLAYANGIAAERWYDWVDSWAENARTAEGRLVPMVVAIGNHETRRGVDGTPEERAPFFYSLFTLPDGLPYYALDFGEYLSILLLDSNHSVPTSGEQAAWLEAALTARADRPHLFAAYHRPAYGTAKVADEHVLRDFVPLFDRFDLDVAFEHDHHTYKRTHRLRAGAIDPEGTLYLGDGAWGQPPRAVPQPDEVWYLAEAQSVNHLILVTLEGAELGTVALTAEGDVIDRWPAEGEGGGGR
jgi:hypothetical protein